MSNKQVGDSQSPASLLATDQASKESSHPGDLYPLGLVKEDGSQSWTSELATSLIWTGPTTYITMASVKTPDLVINKTPAPDMINRTWTP